MAKSLRKTDELTSLPNIGAVVAEKLRAVGVMTPEQLKALGSVEARFASGLWPRRARMPHVRAC